MARQICRAIFSDRCKGRDGIIRAGIFEPVFVFICDGKTADMVGGDLKIVAKPDPDRNRSRRTYGNRSLCDGNIFLRTAVQSKVADTGAGRLVGLERLIIKGKCKVRGAQNDLTVDSLERDSSIEIITAAFAGFVLGIGGAAGEGTHSDRKIICLIVVADRGKCRRVQQGIIAIAAACQHTACGNGQCSGTSGLKKVRRVISSDIKISPLIAGNHKIQKLMQTETPSGACGTPEGVSVWGIALV